MAVALITIQRWFDSRRTADDRGASLIEYALLVVLIAVVCVVAVGAIGQSVSSGYSSTGAGFTAN